MSSMLQRGKVNGFDVAYAIADPLIDDIHAAFKVGETVKDLGEGADVAVNFNYADTTNGCRSVA
ncbi:hypothetical protein [Paenibacillus harenae]|uniref:Uncharacterized protein n=1 Tax=Paenibacillus harenae TaxID=306543 RepID=A0ABT9U526_PAEHA|nr:hypothetical protein [Paenibacillus harenae]MDQ0114342.1 hypothetical protein [Paenibacillus harenae]